MICAPAPQIAEVSMSSRTRLLQQWLQQDRGLTGFSIAPASADASFRRYFRVTLADGATLIAMDAPPPREDCAPFLDVAARLARTGVHVPRVHGSDLAQGFVLLEDLGGTAYLDALAADNVDRLYADALMALRTMQAGADIAGLPPYDEPLLRNEMALFVDWLLGRHLGLVEPGGVPGLWDATVDRLVGNALDQPRAFVHRDYHSRNLMVVDGHNPGIIDFQDAVVGPVTYDLVSLLRDCYVRWPPARVDAWVEAHRIAAEEAGLLPKVDADRFLAWFDLMGVQRHLKAAGIFARLKHRDAKPAYLADIPRTLGYIVEVGQRRPALAPLADYVANTVLPRLDAVSSAATQVVGGSDVR
jgi:aminoglycoside/choline kinase family phosphotransferase